MVTYCDLYTGENCLTDSIKRQSGLERIVMEARFLDGERGFWKGGQGLTNLEVDTRQ